MKSGVFMKKFSVNRIIFTFVNPTDIDFCDDYCRQDLALEQLHTCA